MTIRPLSIEQTPPETSQRHQGSPVARVRSVERRRLIYVVIAFWMIGLACVLALTARGQEAYRKVTLKKAFENPKVVRRAITDAKKFATGGPMNGYVKQYFENYVPAILTDPTHLPEVSEVMEDYVDLLNKAQRSGQNVQPIQDQVFRIMYGVAANNFMPSARISAINVLSLLESAPANTSTKTPPVPLAKTLPVLIKLYEDESNVDGVRAAALHGIHRHVSYGFRYVSAEQNASLTKSMNELLNAKPPQGRSPECARLSTTICR